jgi:ribosomal protein S6
MNKYELTVVLRNKDLDSLKSKVREILDKYGAKIIEDAPWGMKKLAFEISNEKEGFYEFIILELPPESVQKVINEFRLNADILRNLFVSLKSEQSA